MSPLEVLREIDPSAHVSPEATIGPFCVVGPHVTIGPRTVLERRVSIAGHTAIGSDNRLAEGSVFGAVPQDLKYHGGPTRLIIGHRNRFGREVTANVGTEEGGFLTCIGDDNVLLDACHVAHDCYVQDRTRLGERVLLAGHIKVETGAVIEALAGIHHFTTIGRYAYVGPGTPVRRDVPPYTRFCRRPSDLSPAVLGRHEEGIDAADLSPAERRDLRHAMQELFYDESALQTKIEQLVNLGVEGETAALCAFCRDSLAGVFGRHREVYRGKIPPEAQELLTPQEKSWFAREHD